MKMNTDINYIIRQSIKGDKNYQEILLKMLNPLIYKNIYIYYEPKNPLVEDLVQEGYIVILKSLKEYEPNNAHFLYFIKIKLYYFYKNYYRNYIKRRHISIENIKYKIQQRNFNSPLDILILKEERSTLKKCMKELSPKEQEILFLYYFREFSMGEISKKLNISYRASINIKGNAIKKLRKMMEISFFLC